MVFCELFDPVVNYENFHNRLYFVEFLRGSYFADNSHGFIHHLSMLYCVTHTINMFLVIMSKCTRYT